MVITTMQDIYCISGVDFLNELQAGNTMFVTERYNSLTHKLVNVNPPEYDVKDAYQLVNNEWIIINQLGIDAYVRSLIAVPTEIRMAQCRAQLIIDGKDDDVELLLSSIADPIQQKLYRAYFEYEPIVTRDNVMINEMSPALGIDLDSFFISASKL